MKIINLLESNFRKKDLSIFWKNNDYLFPDPFSNHVDIDSYIDKLIENGIILIAVEENTIIGFICFYSNDYDCFDGHIQALFVDNSYRKKGVATELLNNAIKTMKEYGMKRCLLNVDNSNMDAIDFYKKYGFKESNNKGINVNKKAMEYSIGYEKEIDIRDCQMRLLDMAKAICSILENEKIPYMITFGTLLGAVRHKGFIPWDDDFDLFLFSDSYDKAMEVLRKELPKDMFLEDSKSEPLYFHAWAHVKDIQTKALSDEYPQDNIYKHHGISIDLYKTKLMKESEVDLYRLKEELAYIKRKYKDGLLADTVYGLKINEVIKKIENYIIDDNNRLAYGMCLKQRIMYPNEIFPLKKYIFEDTEFLGPNNYDSLLTRFYGKDYMKLPSKNQRQSHYSKIIRIIY